MNKELASDEEKYAEAIKHLNELKSTGELSAEAYRKRVEQLKDEFLKATNEIEAFKASLATSRDFDISAVGLVSDIEAIRRGGMDALKSDKEFVLGDGQGKKVKLEGTEEIVQAIENQETFEINEVQSLDSLS